MSPRYTRVRDKRTGHQYDVLAHKVDPERHTRVNRTRWPDVSQPRPAKTNAKTRPVTPDES